MRRIMFFLLALCTIILTGCAGASSYEVTQEGQVFQVNPQEHTLAWEGHIIHYAVGSDDTSDWVELTYPDGSTFRRYWEDGVRGQKTSENYNPEAYLPGEELLLVLSREIPTGNMEADTMALALGVFCVALGGFYVLRPEHALFNRTGGISGSEGKNRMALRLTRALGGVAVVVGICLLLWGWLWA
ncbi:MAG: hypothetical protein ACOX7N_06805 [Lawsonibacter sp.]|jgi:hypothetical protein